MQVINESSAILSNYEVYSLLDDIEHGKNGQRKPGKDQQQLATITYETLRYLEHTPAGQQSADIIERFNAALEPFKLTKAERLQLLNHRPTTAVEIQLLIEESEERLSEEKLYELIGIVTEILPAGGDDGQATNTETF